MVDLFGGLTDFLEENQADPATYLFFLFVYVAFAAIALPLPIEAALLFNPDLSPLFKALVLGAGKAVGSLVVFYIGMGVEHVIVRMRRWRWFDWLVEVSERFVARFGYYAMFAILAIPFMIDTVPLYLFSIFNREGQIMTLRGFLLVNFLAGTARGLLFLFVVAELSG